MRFAKTATAVLALALLLPAGTVAAQDASPVPSAEPPVGVALDLIPTEAGGLVLREQAMTFSGQEMRDNSDADELVLLDTAIAAAGDPEIDSMGVAAVLASTADGQGGIMLQAIEIPGLAPSDGIAFWTAMLDLANETSTSEEVDVAGKTAVAYTSPDDPDMTAHLYAVEGAAWLIIASDAALLEDVLSELP